MITFRTTPMTLMALMAALVCAFVFVADMHPTVEKAAFVASTTTVLGFLGFSATLASIGMAKVNTEAGGFTPFNWNVGLPFVYAATIMIMVVWQMSGVFQLVDDTAIIGAVNGIVGAMLGVVGAMIEGN